MPKTDREFKVWGGTSLAIATVFILVFAFFVWGFGNETHIASNPGPSGSESTIVNQTPPPAASPPGTAR